MYNTQAITEAIFEKNVTRFNDALQDAYSLTMQDRENLLSSVFHTQKNQNFGLLKLILAVGGHDISFIVQALTTLMNSHALSSVSSQVRIKILSEAVSDNENIFTFGSIWHYGVLSAIISSEVFTSLTSSEKASLLLKNGTNPLLILPSLYKAASTPAEQQQKVLDILLNNDVVVDAFSSEQKYTLLGGEDVLHRLLPYQGCSENINLILNSKLFQSLDGSHKNSILTNKNAKGECVILAGMPYTDGKAAVVQILNDEKITSTLSSEQKYTLLGGEDVLHRLLPYQGCSENINLILNSKLFQSLDGSHKNSILTNKNAKGECVILAGMPYTDGKAAVVQILNDEKITSTLSSEQKYTLLGGEDVLHRLLPYQGCSENINLILNSKLFQSLDGSHKNSILVSKNSEGKGIVLASTHYEDSPNLISSILNNKAVLSLSDVQKLELLSNALGNNFIKHVVTAPKEAAVLDAIFNSLLLQNLNSDKLKEFVTEQDQDGKDLIETYCHYVDGTSHIRNLLHATQNHQFKNIIESLIVGSIPKLSHEAMNILFGALSTDSSFKIAKDLAGFSLAYHIKTTTSKSVATDFINKGYLLHLPKNYTIVDRERWAEYKVEGSDKTALVITGIEVRNSENALYSGLISTLHSKGFNVIAVSGKDGANVNDIQAAIQMFGKKLDFVVIEAHGSRSIVIDSITHQESIIDNSIALGDGANQHINARDMLRAIVDANGRDNPIDVLLGSCHGQTAINAAKEVLPQGSQFVTLGEDQVINGKGYEVNTENVNYLSFVRYLYLRSDLKAADLDIKTALGHYLTHIKTGAGSPTYTKVGGKSESVILSNDIKNLMHDGIKMQKIVSILCAQRDNAAISDAWIASDVARCVSKLNVVVEQIKLNPAISDVNALLALRQDSSNHNNVEQYSNIMALKFGALAFDDLHHESAVHSDL
ncbi:hypothetical protein MIDIC_160006 [Alphaproteobacteria bacterium]